MRLLSRRPRQDHQSDRPARRSLRLVGVLGALLAAAVIAVGAWRQHHPSIPALQPVSATIVPGVSILTGIGPSVAYAIETSDGLVFIDSGLEPDARPLKVEASRLKLDWKKTRAILLTHAHGDHCGGAEQLRGETGARVYAGRGDAAVLRAGGPREAFFSNYYMPDHAPHPTTVDVELDDDETLVFGDTRIQVLAAPGHSPGSLCYLLERSGLRILFTGDVISSLLGETTALSDTRDPLGSYTAYMSPRYRGDARAYLTTLRRFRVMSSPDLVLPGHPFTDRPPQSPQLSTQRWDAILDEGIQTMETLVARYQEDGADFLDGQPKALLPDLYYFGDFHGRAVYGLVAASRFFAVAAPSAPGLGAFLREGQVRLGLEPKELTALLLTSCGPQATAGLKDLVETTHAAVVAPDLGLRAVEAACPPGASVWPASELSRKAGFSIETVPLRGRDVDPVAYVVPWAGKSVLFTDRIPILFDHDARQALTDDLGDSRASAVEYLLSIERLGALTPNLWLPAVPSDGQNANLYDRMWKTILSNNFVAGSSRLSRQH